MTQVLKLAHFIDDNGMPDMQIRGGWGETHLDTQRFAGFQFLLQVFNLDDFFCTPRDQFKGMFYICHTIGPFSACFLCSEIKKWHCIALLGQSLAQTLHNA